MNTHLMPTLKPPASEMAFRLQLPTGHAARNDIAQADVLDDEIGRHRSPALFASATSMAERGPEG